MELHDKFIIVVKSQTTSPASSSIRPLQYDNDGTVFNCRRIPMEKFRIFHFFHF